MKSPMLLFVSTVTAFAGAHVAYAEEKPLTAVLAPSVDAPDLAATGAAFERVLRATLDDLDVVRTAGTPALDLEQLQLAVGCVSYNDACLRAVAEQLSVDALIITSIARAGAETIVTVAFVDRQARTEAVRRVVGDQVQGDLLDAINGMLRELFGLPEPVAPPDVAHEEAVGRPRVEWREQRRFPTVPVIVGCAGLVSLGVGIAFGAMASNSESEYGAAPTSTESEVDEALSLKRKGERQATVANSMIAVGGVAIAGAVVLYFVMPRTERVRVSALVGPEMVGLTVGGAL